jgi:hypothetical protein
LVYHYLDGHQQEEQQDPRDPVTELAQHGLQSALKIVSDALVVYTRQK